MKDFTQQKHLEVVATPTSPTPLKDLIEAIRKLLNDIKDFDDYSKVYLTNKIVY